MSLFLANLWGWAVAHWRLVATLFGIVIVVAAVAVVWRGCRPAPKLDEQQIRKAQQAIAAEDRREMLEVLAESDAREAVADETEINANAAKVNAIKESRDKWATASNAEMAAELERRARESQ